MTDFTVSFATATLAEGGIYSFTIMPKTALASAIKVRWEIVADGKLPISAEDFASLTGAVDFAASATLAQTVTITPTNDAAVEPTQNFEIRVYQVVTGAADILLGTQAVTLTDDDTGAGSVAVTPASNAEGNVNIAANTQDFALNAKGGDDTYIITRFQSGDVKIAESAGIDLIKFDYGVFIARFAEVSTSNFVRLKIESATLTLSTGAEIEIEFPARTTSFQLGDGEIITSYAAFKTAIGASGTNATATFIAESYEVTTFATTPDVSANTIAVAAEILESTGLSDVIGLGSVADVSANGAGGDDIFVVTRFQSGDVMIDDTVGTNIVKFDFGVSITGFSEASRVSFGAMTISLATLTLSTGAEIAISFPAGAFNFQLGDAAVIDTYAAFKIAIGASLSNADSALAATHTISHPSSVNTPLTGAVTLSSNPPSSITIHGLVFTVKAGGVANAATSVTFSNSSGSFSASFSAINNELQIYYNPAIPAEDTLGEVLALLRMQSDVTDNDVTDNDVTDNFVVTTGVGYDASTNSVVLDVEDSISTSYASSAPTTGTILTADTSTIADADGRTGSDSAFSYQWLRAGAEISGATASTYTTKAADAGKALTVRVSYMDDGGVAESVTSIAPDVATTGAVTITPTNEANVGEILTAVTTRLTDPNDAELDFTYQWKKVGTDTVLGSAVTYTPTEAGGYTVTVAAYDDVSDVNTEGFISAAIDVL